jgi:hypothetical protein
MINGNKKVCSCKLKGHRVGAGIALSVFHVRRFKDLKKSLFIYAVRLSFGVLRRNGYAFMKKPILGALVTLRDNKFFLKDEVNVFSKRGTCLRKG